MFKPIGYWLGGLVMGAVWGLSISDEKKRDYQKKIKDKAGLLTHCCPMKKLMTYLWGIMEGA